MRNLGTKSNHLTLQEATTLTRKSSKTDKFSATKRPSLIIYLKKVGFSNLRFYQIKLCPIC